MALIPLRNEGESSIWQLNRPDKFCIKTKCDQPDDVLEIPSHMTPRHITMSLSRSFLESKMNSQYSYICAAKLAVQLLQNNLIFFAFFFVRTTWDATKTVT